ncbi:MAG: YheU family protein [Gammaproteobacteria bacterium]
MTDEDGERFLEVPADSISTDALHALIESFVLREGTDYGEVEYNLEQKVDHVRHQLERGEVAIVYNLEQQSADMLTRAEIRRLKIEQQNHFRSDP